MTNTEVVICGEVKPSTIAGTSIHGYVDGKE